jgi:predicted lipoprotein with Yx(FWY)xxD motif
MNLLGPGSVLITTPVRPTSIRPKGNNTDMASLSLRSRTLSVIGLFALGGIVASACSSGNPGGSAATTTPTTSASTPTTSASAPATSAGSRPVVSTMTVSGVGKVLVNTQGQVLYSFTKNGAPVPCPSSCLQVWPAFTLPGGVTSPTGPAGVGTLATTTANGVTQVTVNGLPLFTYAGDSAPGVANGNNLTSFGGTWKVVPVS